MRRIQLNNLSSVTKIHRGEMQQVSGGHRGFFPLCTLPTFRLHYGDYAVAGFFHCKRRRGFHF